MTLKNIFIKLSLLTITLTLVIQNTLACEELFTGTIVMDKYRNGEVKPLKTIEHIQSTYGDSAPLYNILMSKEAVALKKWDIKKYLLRSA